MYDYIHMYVRIVIREKGYQYINRASTRERERERKRKRERGGK